jgi:phosphopantetheinyl transferase
MDDFLVNRKTNRYHLIVAASDKLCPNVSSKREKEVFASKKIIDILFPNQQLSHDKFGAPILSNGKAISISHSKHLISIIVANKSASIDIEAISEKALKVAPKFLSEQELKMANDAEKATLIWSVKECLFKIYKKGGLTFSTDLAVNDIKESNVECFIFEQKYTLNYEKFEEHWLVYYFD